EAILFLARCFAHLTIGNVGRDELTVPGQRVTEPAPTCGLDDDSIGSAKQGYGLRGNGLDRTVGAMNDRPCHASGLAAARPCPLANNPRAARGGHATSPGGFRSSAKTPGPPRFRPPPPASRRKALRCTRIAASRSKASTGRFMQFVPSVSMTSTPSLAIAA